jgi:hypothetical protein
MFIERDQMNVGQYYVLKVDMRDGAAQIIQYQTDYTKALDFANSKFNADYGYKMVVVEVQGVIQAQGVPNVVTSLTRRM